VGDYFAGPSHVLPTNRTARFFSPLGVPDFLKRTSIIRYSGRGIERFGEMIEKFAIAEGLTGHARSITIRRHQAEVRGLTAYTLKHFAAEVKLDQNENPYELPTDLKR
jgi:hypothetical protein